MIENTESEIEQLYTFYEMDDNFEISSDMQSEKNKEFFPDRQKDDTAWVKFWNQLLQIQQIDL